MKIDNPGILSKSSVQSLVKRLHDEVPEPIPKLTGRITSLSSWWRKQEKSSATPALLLDLRPAVEQKNRQLKLDLGFGQRLISVPLPMELLKARSFELPARDVEFAIFIRESDLEAVSSLLLGIRLGVRKTLSNPWKVTDVLLDTEEIWKQAEELGFSKINQESTTECVQKVSPTFPLPRLWQPDSMVETVLFPLLVDRVKHHRGKEAFQILDLASGSGRDVAFLAEELVAAGMTNCRIVAIDHRYNEKETNIVNDFWDRRGVHAQTQSLRLDLSKLETLHCAIPLSAVSALFCVRFWKRDLVHAIATSSSWIAPGTLFGLSHFCKPYPNAEWDFEHPSVKTVLERNELSTMFAEKWTILHDQIALDSDHGRTMIHFVAKRRSW